MVSMQVTDLKYIKVRPILLTKGDVKVALYGLSNVKDERLHRLFREVELGEFGILFQDMYIVTGGV
jgi:hypothetical protein